MRLIITFLFVITLAISSQAKPALYTEPEKMLSSVEQVDALVRETQKQFWPLVPPGMPLYVHSERKVRPVVWSSGWPNALKKQIYAEIQVVNGSLYPVYTLWAEADLISGDLTYFNMYGSPVWTSSAPAGYSPYSFVLERLTATSADELTDAQKQMSASNVGLEIQLIPRVFLESYEQDVVLEQQMEALFAEPMMMAATSGPPPPGGGGGSGGVPAGGSSTNLARSIAYMHADTNGCMVVEHRVGEDWEPYAVIYGREHLHLGNWLLQEEWAPTYGAEWMVWTDEVHTNKSTFFYQFFSAVDTDSDGRADIVAERNGTSTNGFCAIDSDFDGMLDAWELKLFGDLTGESGSSDFDGDGLANTVELVWNPDDNTVVLVSDPSLFDTDGEGLHDGQEKAYGTNPLLSDTDEDGFDDAAELLTMRTDPNNPDTTSPVVILAF